MRRNLDANVAYAIAFLAFALSYSKLVDLADRAGYGLMAYVWPLVVDGLAVLAARGVMRLATSRRYAWSLLVAGTAVSVFAAILNAMVPAGPLPPFAAALVAVVPPLCLPFASHLARKMRNDEVSEESQPDVTVEDAAPSDPPPASAMEPEPLHLVAPTPRPGKYTEEQKAQALALVAAGVSQREAGRRIGGAPGNTVRRWIAQAQAVA
ncbi:DUF2637 domain-containing protein [Rhodococcus tibetensis]|uniref:DUF2637 domain-containing protein n=1 Tax=Rhodococcus tibetensis TaxID=2965064 RepID=A0ABT1QE25_9NOCA|nr:DUF2637 domain-containing protein [Rhodococcus sp. FXJ9.536]MCQ4119908.1 DUF2637 domain-containing protein [Rhodococcus sp. FXJ9.536]